MLIRFTVGNFLSFKDKCSLVMEAEKYDLKLTESIFLSHGKKIKKSVVIYGSNASGKTNLIKAVAFFRNFVIKGSIQSNIQSGIPDFGPIPFLLNTETESKPSYFEVEMKINSKIFVYGFEASSQKIYKEWLYQYPNKKVLFERNLNNIKSNSRYFKEGLIKGDGPRENVLFLSALAGLSGLISNEVIGAIRKIHTVMSVDKEGLLNYTFTKYTRDENYKKRIKDLFLQADLNIEDIVSEEKQLNRDDIPPQILNRMSDKKNIYERSLLTLHKKFNEKGQSAGNTTFNFFEESEGTQQMFIISGAIVNCLEEGSILILDELDSSLHPLMCRYLLKIFNSSKYNSKNAQLIFTTHDVSLLDEDLLRRDQVWFTQKSDKGSSDLFSLASLGERSNLNFAKRYLEGRYGAIPYIKALEEIR